MKLGGLGAFVRSSLEASAAAASRRARSVAEPKRRLDLSDAVSLVVSLVVLNFRLGFTDTASEASESESPRVGDGGFFARGAEARSRGFSFARRHASSSSFCLSARSIKSRFSVRLISRISVESVSMRLSRSSSAPLVVAMMDAISLLTASLVAASFVAACSMSSSHFCSRTSMANWSLANCAFTDDISPFAASKSCCASSRVMAVSSFARCASASTAAARSAFSCSISFLSATTCASYARLLDSMCSFNRSISSIAFDSTNRTRSVALVASDAYSSPNLFNACSMRSMTLLFFRPLERSASSAFTTNRKCLGAASRSCARSSVSAPTSRQPYAANAHGLLAPTQKNSWWASNTLARTMARHRGQGRLDSSQFTACVDACIALTTASQLGQCHGRKSQSVLCASMASRSHPYKQPSPSSCSKLINPHLMYSRGQVSRCSGSARRLPSHSHSFGHFTSALGHVNACCVILQNGTTSSQPLTSHFTDRHAHSLA